MSLFKKIVIKEEYGGLVLIVDDRDLETNLTKDELLAGVASALFGSEIRYVKPFDRWLELQKKYHPNEEIIDPRKD